MTGFVVVFIRLCQSIRFNFDSLLRWSCVYKGGCSFWYWEEDYIDLLIEKKLIDVCALIGRIRANDAAACAIREETWGSNVYFFRIKEEERRMQD